MRTLLLNLLLLCCAVPAWAAGKPSMAAVHLLLQNQPVAQVTVPAAAPHLEIVVKPDVVKIPESGQTTVLVALSRPPAGALVASVARVSGDTDLGVLPASASVSFTDADWYVFKPVTLTAQIATPGNSGRAGFLITSGTMKTSFTGLMGLANPPAGSHAARVAAFEGTATCIACHRSQALDMLASEHYQWQGSTNGTIVGAPRTKMGKLGSINDFCTYPDINWLSKMTTVDGRIVDGGCARCHPGLGAKPVDASTLSGDALEAQLRNIDCLICHSPSYKRKVVETTPGVFAQQPDEAAMGMTSTKAAQNIIRPGASQCLTCHTKSGGGNNNKRGDIEEFHKSPTRSFDVHLAAMSDGGAGKKCTDCHTTTNHRIAGRGSDLLPTDNQNVKMSCGNGQVGCHAAPASTPYLTPTGPHNNLSNMTVLNRHAVKVNCTVCHIPNFAKVAGTDMHRDFSKPGDLVLTTMLYEPKLEKANNVTPVYRFWNGQSQFYFYDTPVNGAAISTGGRQLMSGPVGGINDAGSKLHAFKYHKGEQARDLATGKLIPLKMGKLFQTGDNTAAITLGAAAVGMNTAGFDYVPTERYLGIFHGVEPRTSALSCASCHTGGAPGGRVDFAGLGYTPTVGNNPTSCSSKCHGYESDATSWKNSGIFFTQVHDYHVRSKGKNCSSCHSFSR